MPLPFTSLNAATSAGAGSSADLNKTASRHTMIVTTTGAPGYEVALEGSNDGSNWVTLGTVSSSLAVEILSVSAHLVRYVRARLIGLSGGTLTATIASE